MTTDPTPHRTPARGRALLIVGLVILALGAASYSLASADVDRTDLVPSGPPTPRDGALTQTYVVPPGTEVLASGTLMGMYRFQAGSGDVHVLGCADHARFQDGAPARSSATVLRDVTQGMFHVDVGPLVSEAAVGPCASDVFVVLVWQNAGDRRAAPPTAVVELVQNPKMDGPLPTLLLGGAAAGLVLAAMGIVRMKRERRASMAR